MYNISDNITIKKMFDYGINFLKLKNIESPGINTESLLCHILNLSRIEIRLKFNEIISSNLQEQFIAAIENRANHIPLQYIIGKIKFHNIEININKNVLIPRPETEELTKLIISEININPYKNYNILDIGTGSGCISLAIAKEFPNIKIDGIDISKSAIECANENKNKLNIENIIFKNIDFENFKSNKKYDIIISNPPYISINDYIKLKEELFFEPKIALTDNNDGLTFYRIISQKSNDLLNKNGKIFLECGINQAKQICFMFNKNGNKTKILNDFSNIERFIIVER